MTTHDKAQTTEKVTRDDLFRAAVRSAAAPLARTRLRAVRDTASDHLYYIREGE